ncbi:MAG: cytochrome C552 [Alphaproteobacteria bacterium]|nr:MAG: cytochrome C552 [Alphaproteobacteria bacterium]
MTRSPLNKKSFFSRKVLLGSTIAGAFAFFVFGIIFWGGFNTAMEATNTLGFCISCHEMEENVYQEYKPTIHFANRTGVQAGCPDCHVPDPWIHKIVRKIQATNELYHKAMGTIDTPEKFNTERLAMAKRVWKTMKETDSRECRNCHHFDNMKPEFQAPRARNQHLNAFKTGQTCIDCHKGIAHNNVRHLLSDEELEELEKPNPAYIRDVPKMFAEGMKRVALKEAAEAEAEKLARKEEKASEAKRTAVAIDEALALYKTKNGKSKKQSTSTINVDWAKASSRLITLFYPGETSIEWVLNGRDHGGARPFDKGNDRCVTCHDKETADMGQKMVTGEKAESRPIPGKRGSIPVTVEATHDDDYLYMRFSWAEGGHVPVPFVDGGKMDPANPMKLAIMLSTNDVEYADRAGCWSSCHHDANNMPHSPNADTLSASPFAARLDFSGGVSKYLKESRTKIEVKGRRGKMRGGWDKLKDAQALKAEMEMGKYIDLIRYKSGEKISEDGHIFAQRVMTGGQGTEFEANLKAGTWSLVMKRKLASDQPGDISLSLNQVYNFGFAIHDDYSSSRFHHVSLGYKLGFDNDAVEVNATKQ